MTERSQALMALTLSTIAFTVCFAAWLINGVLITFLVDVQAFEFDKEQIGWLIGLPVLTGALARLPVGILTDRFGGRIVFTALMLISAVPMYLASMANTYGQFLLAGLGFGLTGASFAVGIAHVALWFDEEHIGAALGVFGAGNAGAAITSIFGPMVLARLTDDGQNIEGWRGLPKIYAAALVIMAIFFFALTRTKKAESGKGMSLSERLAPLADARVWRFGVYYFLVFGGFVALAQWMIPYYVNAYQMTVASAGMLAAVFSLPSGVIRALGGWLADHWGARAVMYWVFGTTAVACALLVVPRMNIQSPGQGVMAAGDGMVESVTPDAIQVGDRTYKLTARSERPFAGIEHNMLVFPKISIWQEPVVKQGDPVVKRQLLARGITNIFFQANVWIFTGLLFIVGIAMGLGMAGVYKFIPQYFPGAVGVTGGMVGVIGGLGGFVCPIIFGYLLSLTGLWTSCWMFLTVLTLGCLIWMHLVIRSGMIKKAPELVRHIEH